MTHFGIICPAATGHLNPMTTLGYELKNRGHRVTLIGVPDAEAKTLAAGLEFKAIGKSEFPLGSTVEAFAQLGQLSGLAALKYTIALFAKGAQILLKEAPKVIQEIAIEVLLVDQTSSGGGTVAEYLNIPFVTISSALMINQDYSVPPFNTTWNYNPASLYRLRNWLGYQLLGRVAQPIRKVVAQYRQEWNLTPHVHPNDAYSPVAQLSQQPAEFEFPRTNLPSCFHFTGPYSNTASREPVSFPWEQLTEQPLIYASLGTLQNRLLAVFQTIAAACQGLDAQLVISLGGSADPDSLSGLPGSPIVVKYAPQLELLPKAALTITHAGLNTTLESLSNGVPMVAIPIANDQPGVSSRIVWTGTGEAVSLKNLSVSKLHNAIAKVLTDTSYSENALRLQQAISKAGGVKRAADIIEGVVISTAYS